MRIASTLLLLFFSRYPAVLRAQSTNGSIAGRVTFEPGRGPHGIRIHSVRLSSSPPAAAGFSAKGGPIEEIHPGDVVWFSPGEKHWHGATAKRRSRCKRTHRHFRKRRTEKWSTGWNRSATSNTASKIRGPITNESKERTMPHVIVKLWPGKSEQQKIRLAEGIAKHVMNVLNYGEESAQGPHL